MSALTSCKAVLRAAWKVTLPGDAHGQSLERVVADLRDLNRLTERDFLAVGEKLMQFRSASRQISADMSTLTELISGEHGNHAGLALENMLESSRAMNSRIQDSGRWLETIRDLAVRLRRLFDGLPQSVLLFRTLCTLTRIETARLGERAAGFVDLAEEVSPLSDNIQVSGERVVKAAAHLDAGVQTDLQTVSTLQQEQLRELQPLIATLNRNMKAFAESQEGARQASIRQACQYEAVCAAIDDLVRAIQFHDITRQQVEHTAEALSQLRGPGAPDPRSLMLLQSSQLQSAGRLFESAVAGIEGNLENIAARLSAVALESRTLMGISEEDHTSFFLRLEACFSTILQALASCTAAQAQVQATAADISQGVDRMRESVAEIRALEIRIQRTALNATISAAHIDRLGDALSIIAGGMQTLVSSSTATTEEASGVLDNIGDAARTLTGTDAAGNLPADCAEDMKRAILELHSASEVSFSRVNQIADLGSRLAEEIGSLRAGFSAGRIFAEVVGRACETLQQIAGALPQGPAAASTHLDELAQNYTMQVERDVHQTVTQGRLVDSCETQMGDNVELF